MVEIESLFYWDLKGSFNQSFLLVNFAHVFMWSRVNISETPANHDYLAELITNEKNVIGGFLN